MEPTEQNTLATLTADWNTLGTMFNAAPSARQPDLERLVLRTAAFAHGAPILMPMAATWLARNPTLLADERLARLAKAELAAEAKPVLGLLLETARQQTPALRPSWRRTEKTCQKPAGKTEPTILYDIQKRNPLFAQLAKKQSSPLALKWGLYADPIEPKHDAMRARWWVPQSHPMLQFRADCMGDLRVSIVASLLYDEGAGESEAALQRACGASRTGLRDALDRLELAGRIERVKVGRNVKISLRNEGQYR